MPVANTYMMKGRTFLLLLIVLCSEAGAQVKWTLDDCINYAVKNNLALKQTSYNRAIEEQNYIQAKWNRMPSVGARAQAYYYAGRYVDTYTNEIVTVPNYYSTFSISASMDIFNGFSLENKIRYLKYKKEAASSLEADAVDDLAFTVMNAFYDVIYYEELLKITQEQKGLSEINVRKTQALVDAGLKATTDLLEVKANLEMEELACIQTSNQLQSSWISLHKAMNISSDTAIVLSRPDLTTLNDTAAGYDVKELYADFSSWAPQLKSAEAEMRAGKKNVSIYQAAFLPSLEANASLGADYRFDSHAEFYRQLKETESKYAGLTLSVPIFYKRNNLTNVKIAKLQYASSVAKLDQAKQDLYFEMMTNINDLKASSAELLQARRQLDADTLAYRASEMKYGQGLVNVVDLYTVKNRMTSAYAQVLRSELTAEIKKRIIDFYRGNRFWER